MNLSCRPQSDRRFPTVRHSGRLLPLVLLLTLFAVGPRLRALDPVYSSAYGGGYYHYQNASPAYRHGVKTPFNSFPQIPSVPMVQMPTVPVVPVPTMADLLPNPQNAPHPYIGAGGVGYYSDDVMAEYDPDRYRNPNPNHRNRHHHATDNPQEVPDAYQGSDGDNDRPNGDTLGETTDKPTKKSKKSSKLSYKKSSSKKSKKSSSSKSNEER